MRRKGSLYNYQLVLNVFNTMVIGLIGPKLSGKGTAAAYLVEQYGAKTYSMSGILTEMAARLHLPNTRANLIAIVSGLRSTLGEDILARVLKQDIEESGEALVVIDGIRMPMEVDIFSQLTGFRLVYIDAPVRLRYERALTRGEKEGEAEMTFEEFEAEESAATEKNIAHLQERATTVIDNSNTLETFHHHIDELMSTTGMTKNNQG
jgi:dephospho-CoA kinase